VSSGVCRVVPLDHWDELSRLLDLAHSFGLSPEAGNSMNTKVFIWVSVDRANLDHVGARGFGRRALLELLSHAVMIVDALALEVLRRGLYSLKYLLGLRPRKDLQC